MLPVNDLRKGDAIILDGETYLVMDAHFHRAQQRKANVRTKLKNMIKGNIIEKTFSSTESVEEADISYRKAQYLYEEGNSYIFMILDNYEQVHVDAEVLGDNKYYLLDNSEVDLQYINDEVTAVRFPIHVIFPRSLHFVKSPANSSEYFHRLHPHSVFSPHTSPTQYAA